MLRLVGSCTSQDPVDDLESREEKVRFILLELFQIHCKI
jgi:hypothetical protein